jgi:hypothetical protein
MGVKQIAPIVAAILLGALLALGTFLIWNKFVRKG